MFSDGQILTADALNNLAQLVGVHTIYGEWLHSNIDSTPASTSLSTLPWYVTISDDWGLLYEQSHILLKVPGLYVVNVSYALTVSTSTTITLAIYRLRSGSSHRIAGITQTFGSTDIGIAPLSCAAAIGALAGDRIYITAQSSASGRYISGQNTRLSVVRVI